MTYYKSKRPVNGKPPIWVIADENGKIVNRNPSKDELKDLKREKRYYGDTRNFTTYTDEELLGYPIQFYKEYGRIPTASDFNNNPGYPNSGTYQKRFGGWTDTLKLVGFDVESIVKKGVLITNQHKARFAEIIVRDHFKNHPVDLAGENCRSPCDGVCPNGKSYDVKSSKLHIDVFWSFGINNKYKEEIEIYYLLGFNEDWTKLDYGWRIPGEIVEKDNFRIGLNPGYEFNVENMIDYDITDRLKDALDRYYRKYIL